VIAETSIESVSADRPERCLLDSLFIRTPKESSSDALASAGESQPPQRMAQAPKPASVNLHPAEGATN
jgi:hypothetical protein